MENQIQIFQNEKFGQVRTTTIEGEPWFVAADICRALDIKNSRQAMTRLDDDEKDVVLNDTPGGMQSMTAINEAGLYTLILSSRKPEVKAFKRWITHEVIPSIRKYGLYATEELLNNPDVMIAILTELKNEREKAKALTQTVAIQEQQIAEMQPKATYYDIVLNCKDLISTTVVAKDYGKSAIWMNNYLREKGIQFKQGNIWLLYQKYAQNGYTSTKTYTTKKDGKPHICVYTCWTQKGRLFIYELLKQDGILPLIERETA